MIDYNDMMQGDKYTVNSDSKLGAFISFVTKLHQDSGWVTYKWVKGMPRTLTQNRAIHQYFHDAADALNNHDIAAYIQSPLFENPIEVAWNEYMIKDLWRLVQKAKYPETGGATRKCPVAGVEVVYDYVNKAILEGSDGAVYVPFPSRDEPTSARLKKNG